MRRANILNSIRLWVLVRAAWLWRRLMFRTTFIAVTGSVGKTTTKDLIAATLGGLPAPTFSSFASANTGWEIARTLLRVRPWHRFAVFEVASGNPGEIRIGARMVAPHIAVVLSVARTHTNSFLTPEETAAEKATLLEYLRPGGVAILNADDALVAAMSPAKSCRVVRFGCSGGVDVRAENIGGHWPDRLSLSVFAAGSSRPDAVRASQNAKASARVHSQLVGVHWTSAILATIAVALECGMALSRAASLVSRLPPSPGRMSPEVLPNGAVILRDEFNGSLDTFLPAFEVLRTARAGRKILLVTSVIDTSESWDKRIKRIAQDAARVVDMLILVGARDDTRRAGKAALAAGLAPDGLRDFSDLQDAAAFLRLELRSGDLLLLRGRTQDHLTRLYYAQTHDVVCWLPTCPKRILCDHCPELLASGERVGTLVKR